LSRLVAQKKAITIKVFSFLLFKASLHGVALSSASIVLVVVSLVTLALGFQIWRLTSNGPIILNTVVASAGLLFAAFKCSTPGRDGGAYLIPFLLALLFAGRGIGTYWRSRKETALRLPAALMFAASAASLYATVAAYNA
jgi:hypothetical protein